MACIRRIGVGVMSLRGLDMGISIRRNTLRSRPTSLLLSLAIALRSNTALVDKLGIECAFIDE